MRNIYVISIGVLNIMAVIINYQFSIFILIGKWGGGGVQNIMALIN